MATTYNVFVKLLDGTTANLKFQSPTIYIETLKQHLYKITQIPPQHQRLITGTHQLNDSILSPENNVTIHLLTRLLGGKGGFGSLLRGASTVQKKTTNFDSCRDMSGRRLRHVNAEKRLQEWDDEKGERKLEKAAEDFIRKRNKEVKKSGTDKEQRYIAKYKEDSRKCMESVEASVRASLGRYEDSKRKMLPTSGSAASKRLKLWMKEEDESDNSDDDEDEKSVVLDKIHHPMRKEDENGIGTARFELGEGSRSATHTDSSPELELVNVESEIRKETNGQSIGNLSPAVEGTGSKGRTAEVNGSVDEAAAGTTMEEKPLKFDDYSSAAELEVLGMERLKAELGARGLKCGGTLRERATRLFLLKTTPLEMLPKKLFSKK